MAGVQNTARSEAGDGGALTVSLTALAIAWRNGPALQVTLTEAQDTTVARAGHVQAAPQPRSMADIVELRDIPPSREASTLPTR